MKEIPIRFSNGEKTECEIFNDVYGEFCQKECEYFLGINECKNTVLCSYDKRSLGNIQAMIAEEFDRIKAIVLEKNHTYGNSIHQPTNIFSKSSPEEQLNVRLDDKIKRVKDGDINAFDESPEEDIIGYLIHKIIMRKLKNEE